MDKVRIYWLIFLTGLICGCDTPESGPSKSEKPPKDILKAAAEGDMKAVANLLDNGADINAKDANGKTPLHLAAIGGDTKIAEILIEKGADVNAMNNNGETPLHMAASQLFVKIIAQLITKGADVNAKNNEGATPLDHAELYSEMGMSPEKADQCKSVTTLLRKHGGKTGKELKAEKK
jgi:ankyrin repeat protein